MKKDPTNRSIEESRKKLILLGEKVSVWDLVSKYIVRDTIFWVLGVLPGAYGVVLRMFLLRPFFQKMGRGATIKNYATFKFPERISIGDQVGISEYSLFNGDGGIDIGNFVRIASHVVVVSFDHDFSDTDVPIKLQKKNLKKVVIEDDVWIGTHAVILAGVRVGKGSVVAAGSVVTRDVPEYSVVAGVPAQVIKSRK